MSFTPSTLTYKKKFKRMLTLIQMYFAAKLSQVFNITDDPIIDLKGWTIFVHPELLLKSELHKAIQHYSFFSYDVNEALHISEKEKVILTEFVNNIKNEIAQNLDRHS